MKVDLVSRRDDQTPGGFALYAQGVAEELDRLVDVERVQVPKWELRVGKLAVGGALSLALNTRLARVRDDADIVHAVDVTVLHPETNVLSVHDVIPLQAGDSWYSRLLRGRFEQSLEQVDRFIAMSDAAARDAAEVLDLSLDRFRTVYQAIDHENIYPAGTRPDVVDEADRTALFVGEFTPRKNIHRMIEAVAELPGWQLVRAGPPERSDYVDRCLDLAEELDVAFRDLGYVSRAMLRRLFTFADVNLFISEAEGFGRPPLEAAACGTPTVCSDLRVFREVYGDLVAYTPSLDAPDVAGTIADVADDPPPAEQLKAFAREFTWEATAEGYVEVYEEIA